MGGHDYDDSISAVCERCDSNSGDRDTGARALTTMLCNVCLCTVVINFVEFALTTHTGTHSETGARALSAILCNVCFCAKL